MLIKARKVGNSLTLTIPSSFVETMKLQDGQELEADYNAYSNTLSYRVHRVQKINWDDFISQDTQDIRDGMTPEDYVRKLRDFDREEIVL